MRILRHVAAVLVAAAATLVPVGVAAPAHATECPTTTGVTVVVDKGGLGGGISQVCDAGGGGKLASAIFPEAGYPLSYVRSQPGFVCRVSGAPSSATCANTPPADAYWGLWWSNGSSSQWTYSSLGVGSLRIPAGGSVAFAWNDGGEDRPGIAPTVHAPSGSGGSGQGGSGDGGSGSGSAGGNGGTGSTPAPTPSAPPSSAPPVSPTPSAAPTPSAPAPSSDGSDGSGGSDDASPSPRATPTAEGREGSGDKGDTDERRDRDDKQVGAAGGGPSASPSDEESVEVLDEPFAPEAAQEPAASGLPGWVAPGVIGALLLVAAGVGVLRRVRGGTGRS